MAAQEVKELLERAAGARFVLIGEASHGTHEFYRARAYEAEIAGALPGEQQVVDQLLELRSMDAEIASRNGHLDEDRHSTSASSSASATATRRGPWASAPTRAR
jgi:hypothetical protein